MKTKDRINVRLEPHQIELLAEATKLLGNKLKESHVIRAALDHYFSCPTSVLPNGKAVPRIPSIEVKPLKLREVHLPKKTKKNFTPSTLREVPTPAGMKKEKPLFTPNADILAGASTHTGKRINPNTNGKTA